MSSADDPANPAPHATDASDPKGEVALSAGPVRRAILRGVALGIGSSLIFLFVVTFLVAAGLGKAMLVFWGFLVGLVATPIAFLEIVLRRWSSQRRFGAILLAGLVLGVAWLGVSAGWVQANWTLTLLATGDGASAYDQARRASGQIFDGEGIVLALCMAWPFALTAFARLRAWPLWGQGALTFVVSLLAVVGFKLTGLLRGDEMFSICMVLAGGLAFCLPLACAGTDLLERRIWGARD